MIMDVASKVDTDIDAPRNRRTRLIVVRTVIVLSIAVFVTLFCLFVYGTLKTNRIVSEMRDFEAGTPLSAVIAQFGEPDRVDTVDGTWVWGRRLVHTDDAVTTVAAYKRNISPQICAYHLDAQDNIVKIEVFASY